MSQPINQPSTENWIACAVCFNQKSERVPATMLVNSISVCDDHFDIASKPSFTIWSLGTRKGSA
jgi:hypothetical protein